MTEMQIVDAKERELALDVSRSFCVQAPAGSGKTELLTQRFLKLLLSCDEPEEILAFTFTRKAAFEMRQRLLKSLKQVDASNLTPLTKELGQKVLQRDQERQWHLHANPQRLQISTIDAFNSSLCAQLPVVSGLGGRVDIIDPPEQLYHDACIELFTKLENDESIATDLARFLEHLDNNLGRAQDLLSALLGKREQWLPHMMSMYRRSDLRKVLSSNLEEVILEAISVCTEELTPFSEKLLPLLRFAALNLERAGDASLNQFKWGAELPAINISAQQAWMMIANFLLTRNGELRKPGGINNKNGFPAKDAGKDAQQKHLYESSKNDFKMLLAELAQSASLLEALQSLQVLPTSNYGSGEWDFLEALSNILIHLVTELITRLQKENKADYIHISSSALEALGEEDAVSDLALRLDLKIKHLLVDEFQDTSHQQIELLKKLTQGWQPDDGRTLFIVGDGMQSCYGFRNADVGIFLKLRDQGIGYIMLDTLQLKMNFRSHQHLVSHVNRLFSSAFPARDNISRGAVAYSASQATRKEIYEGLYTTLLIHPAGEKIASDIAASQEAQYLVQQILQLRTNKSKSIAILVRSRSHLREIIPALREANLTWNAAGIDSLSGFSVIKDLISLLQSLHNQADITALFSLLRCPFVGLKLQDIHSLKRFAEEQEFTLWQALVDFMACSELSKDAQKRLGRVIPILLQARNNRGWQPIRDWLENYWTQLGGPACLKNEFELSYVERFLSLLENEAQGSELLDIHHFRRRCQETFLGSSLDGEADLQIMTIHNAKGLEFDYVLLPGLDRTPPSGKKALFLWQEQTSMQGKSRLLLAPLHANGEEDNPSYRYLEHEADIRRKLENIRLLYIAVTRAREQAFLYAQLQLDDKGNYKEPARSSLLNCIWPELGEREDLLIIKAIDDDNQSKTARQVSQQTLQRLSEDWQAKVQTNQPRLTDEKAKFDSHQSLLEKRIGDIIHRCLQLKVNKSINVLTAGQLKKFRALWKIQLHDCCRSEKDFTQALQEIEQHLQNCMQHKKASWLFDPRHEGSACELSLSDYRGDWRREYVIDRSFIADGVRWIIDYKSSRPKTGQSLQNFLREQEVEHQAQLKRYAELFQEMEGMKIKIALFFTAIPYWHELNIKENENAV
jgi:ATP-dependent helicase/nuclease subunit A